MTRPNQNTDLRLIRAARSLLPVTGCRDLNLREVARKAQVNLGMFHYHFGSKEAFLKRVIEDIYFDFFSDFSEEAGPIPSQAAFERRLERLLFRMGTFARDNRGLFVVLLKDVLDGNRDVARFLGEIAGNNVRVFLALFDEARVRGYLPPVPLETLLVQMMTLMNGPTFVTAIFERLKVKKPFHLEADEFQNLVVSDQAIAERARFAARTFSRFRPQKPRRNSPA